MEFLGVGAMAYAYAGDGALDYVPCQYGGSKLLFRGPRRDLDLPYVVALGGTETYGKFIPRPWPDLAEAATGLRMVNLGCVNASADVYLSDPAVIAVAARARLAILQVMGAANLTNRFYAVHPRRNDRFLRASLALTTLYPEVDFTNFHFTRHLLRTLQQVSPRRFQIVAEELRQTWLDRMKLLVAQVGVPVVLLWMAARAPQPRTAADLSADPLLVDQPMMQALRMVCAQGCEVVLPPQGRDRAADGKVFAPLERPAAEGLPGPAAHAKAASALADLLDTMVPVQAENPKKS